MERFIYKTKLFHCICILLKSLADLINNNIDDNPETVTVNIWERRIYLVVWGHNEATWGSGGRDNSHFL